MSPPMRAAPDYGDSQWRAWWVVALVTSLGSTGGLCRVCPASAGVSQTEEVEVSSEPSVRKAGTRTRRPAPGMTVRGWSPDCDNTDISHRRPVTRRVSQPRLSLSVWHWLVVVKYPGCSSLLPAAQLCTSAAAADGKVWSMFVKVRIPRHKWQVTGVIIMIQS